MSTRSSARRRLLSSRVAALVLAALLLAAAGYDLAHRRIPNWLTFSGLLLGVFWHAVTGGGPGLVFALEGLGIAGLTVLLWMAKALGAGDVKLLGVVGVWMGPVFLLWTLLGTIFAGGLLALIALAVRRTCRGRMPLAPAVALGSAGAFFWLHLKLIF